MIDLYKLKNINYDNQNSVSLYLDIEHKILKLYIKNQKEAALFHEAINFYAQLVKLKALIYKEETARDQLH